MYTMNSSTTTPIFYERKKHTRVDVHYRQSGTNYAMQLFKVDICDCETLVCFEVLACSIIWESVL